MTKQPTQDPALFQAVEKGGRVHIVSKADHSFDEVVPPSLDESDLERTIAAFACRMLSLGFEVGMRSGMWERHHFGAEELTS